MGDFRDWKDTGWDKRGGKTRRADLNDQKRKGRVGSELRPGRRNSQGAQPPGDDPPKRRTVSVGLRVAIQKERVGAGFRTQKEFATACNLPLAVVQNYEAGKGTPSPQVIQKMERALRRKNPEFVQGTLTKASKR